MQDHSSQAIPNQHTCSFLQPTEHAQHEVLLPKRFDALVLLAVGYTRVVIYPSGQLDLQGLSQ